MCTYHVAPILLPATFLCLAIQVFSAVAHAFEWLRKQPWPSTNCSCCVPKSKGLCATNRYPRSAAWHLICKTFPRFKLWTGSVFEMSNDWLVVGRWANYGRKLCWKTKQWLWMNVGTSTTNERNDRTNRGGNAIPRNHGGIVGRNLRAVCRRYV